MSVFKPTPRQPKKDPKGHILLDLKPEVYLEVKKVADANGVSMKEFCRQAVRFALDSM